MKLFLRRTLQRLVTRRALLTSLTLKIHLMLINKADSLSKP